MKHLKKHIRYITYVSYIHMHIIPKTIPSTIIIQHYLELLCLSLLCRCVYICRAVPCRVLCDWLFLPAIVVDVVCHWYFIQTHFNNLSQTLLFARVWACKRVYVLVRSQPNSITFDQHFSPFISWGEREREATIAIFDTIKSFESFLCINYCDLSFI